MSRHARFALVIGLALAPAALPQEAAEFFRLNCYSCHTIGGGRLTGPDLKGVTQRKERAWLVQFLADPKAKIEAGDPYALKLQQEARGVVMPSISGLTRARAEALLDLIDAESKLEKSHFPGLQLSDRPATPEDIAQGRQIFLGTKRTVSRAPACIGCHTIKGVGGLGGGRLGPDLTRVFERLGGRKPLGAWLFGPATPTMQPILRQSPLQPEEIFPLTAFFEEAAKKGGQDDSASTLNFFLLGLAGAVLALVFFDAAWRRRFRAVRRPLVQGNGLVTRG